MEMSLSHGSFSVKYTNAVLPWLLLLLCPNVNQSVKVCQSVCPHAVCHLQFTICHTYGLVASSPPPSFPPMQCHDCRIALVEFDIFFFFYRVASVLARHGPNKA